MQAVFAEEDSKLHFFARLESGIAGLTTIALDGFTAAWRTFLNVAYGELAQDGATLTIARMNGDIQLLDTASGAALHHLDEAAHSPRKLDYLPDAARLIVADGQHVTIWDVAASEMDARLPHPVPVFDFHRSAHGSWLLTEDESGTWRLWHVEGPAELQARIQALNLPRDLTCVERAEYQVRPLCE